MNYSNGDIYKGYFSADIKCGYGELVTKQYKYTGWFKKDLFNGIGEIVYNDGIKLKGEFFNG